MGTEKISVHCLNRLKEHDQVDLKGVISTPGLPKGRGLKTQMSEVECRAQELSLSCLTPHDLKSLEFMSQVKSLKADWVVVLAYGKILPKSFLSLYPRRALNFHASLLPRWRGAAPIQRAIMAGDSSLGMSLQVMEPRLDTGDIIGTRFFALTDEMDSVLVFKKMEELTKDLLEDMIEYMKGSKTTRAQDERKSSYAPKIDKKKDSLIVWSESATKIFNQIRGLAVGPQAYTFYKGRRLKVYKAEKVSQQKFVQSNEFGSICALSVDGFQVCCGNGVIKIKELQLESKRRMSATEFIKGCHLQKGEKLGERDE